MKIRAGWIGLFLLVSASPASAQDPERLAMAQVRFTTEPAVTAQCTALGQVSDDSVKDLRRKIVRAGGNTGLLSFGIEEMSQIYARVFLCPRASAAPPATVPPPPPPVTVPPPPPGPPPPPPPPR
jgi:hypothetical protein